MTTSAASTPAFATDKPRSKTIPLEWPITFAGKTYEALTIRRVTTEQVVAWADAVRKKLPDVDLGNVVDDEGKPVPAEVLSALDPDDDEAVGGVITSFLPRRLRGIFDAPSET